MKKSVWTPISFVATVWAHISVQMQQTAVHKLPTSPFSIQRPEAWELLCVPLCKGRNTFSVKLYRATDCLGKILSRDLHLASWFISACKAGWVRFLPWRLAFKTQSLEKHLLGVAADTMTQGWTTVQRDQTLLQTIPRSFTEHLLLFSHPLLPNLRKLN